MFPNVSVSSSSSWSCPATIYPSRPASGEEAEPLIGYPVLTPTGDGQPIYAYILARPRRRRPGLCHTNSCTCTILLLLAVSFISAFFMWPRTIEMTVSDLTLSKIHFNIKKGDSFIPQVFLDLTLDLRLQARNPNFFGVTYENFTVSISYEDDEIAEVESYGAELDALSTSYANATLDIHSYQIASNVLRLLADIASKALPLQTVTICKGHINVLLFKLPLEGKATCNLVVNPQDQIVISQDCDG
eukprot:c20690_g1_i1 orf=38-772(+)